MVILLFVIVVVLAGISGRLLAQAIILPRLQLKHHLRAIGEYGFARASDQSEDRPASRRREAPRRLAARMGRFTMTHASVLTPLKPSDLTVAGFYDASPEVVHGYRALAAIGAPGLILCLLLLSGGAISMLELLLIAAAAGAGWQMPAMAIKRRGAARLSEMERQLPDLIDLLIATVEAGMGFAGSIALIAGRFHGALGDEMRLTIRQQSLGMSNEEALEEMAVRCDSPMVRSFVRTVTRGESLGVSIGPILRELTADMRRRRRQAAREKIQKAPVKMLFPLMFLIFPALMTVLMYPAMYSVMKNMSGIGG